MPIVMPPVSPPTGDEWVSLEFGKYYLKAHPEAAPSSERGLVQDDLDMGIRRGQNKLEALMSYYFGEDLVTAWTSSTVPPMIADWCLELSSAETLHNAASSFRLDRKEDFSEWIRSIIESAKEWCEKRMPILDVNGDPLEYLDSPGVSVGKGPMVSTDGRREIFTDLELEELVEVDSKWLQDYTTEEEGSSRVC